MSKCRDDGRCQAAIDFGMEWAGQCSEGKCVQQRETHTLYKCGDNCEGCWSCNGGLALCTVCNGAEGSLPTDCPGNAMDSTTETAVYSGELDYKNGQWVTK